jgi:hypothetical protein
MLRVFAAAYAADGRFSEAIATVKQALTRATAPSTAGLTKVSQADLELYETGAPLRSTGNYNAVPQP